MAKRTGTIQFTFSVWVDRYYVGNLHRPQVYGTYWKYSEKGSDLEDGVQNPDRIDETRTAIGLAPLHEYLEMHKECLKPSWYIR